MRWIGMIPLLIAIGCALFFGSIIALLIYLLRRFQRQANLVRSLKVSKIDNLKEGMRKVKGRIVAHEDLLRSPWSRKKCVYYRFRVAEYRHHSSGGRGGSHGSYHTVIDDVQYIASGVEDDTGEADLDFKKVEVSLKTMKMISNKSLKGQDAEAMEDLLQRRYNKSTKGWLFKKDLRITEEFIEEGARVHVVGKVEQRRSGTPVFRAGETPLLISDQGEKQLTTGYTTRIVMCWIGLAFAVIFLVGSVGITGFVGFAFMGAAAGPPALPNVQHFGKPPAQPGGDKPAVVQPKQQPRPRPINPAWDEQRMQRVFLSDMTEQHAIVGHGRFGKGGLIGHSMKPGEPDSPITVGGRNYPRAISLIPLHRGHSTVKYQPGGRFKLFKGWVALNDMYPGDHPPASPATFMVLGDGQLLWASRPLQQAGAAEEFRLGIEGVQVLELQVHVAGSMDYVRAVWLDPHIMQ